jgi:uncharacterized membrane protein YphA (DoxX/SURF4 family)
MNTHGVILESPKSRQWVSWAILRQSAVSRAGVRLQFPESPYRFYAVPMSIIGGMDHRGFEPILARWKTCSLAVLDDIEATAFQTLSPKSDSSIWFRCAHRGCTKEWRRKMYWALLWELVFGIGVLVGYCFRPTFSWLFGVLLLMALWAICARVYGLRNPIVGTELQWGWVTSDRCVMGWNQSGFESPTEWFRRKFVDDERLTITHVDGGEWTIFRTTLVEPTRWTELIEMFRNHP